LEIDAMCQFKKYETLDIFIHRFGCSEEKLFTIKIINALNNYLKNNETQNANLVYFLNNRQIMHSTDISNLGSVKQYLTEQYKIKVQN
jgi:hypothetical protein